MRKPIKVIIDTDLGLGTQEADIDDAIALLLAFQVAEIEVMGITTVHGNTPVSVGTKNVLRLLYLMHKNIRVACGTSRPIILDQPEKMERPSKEVEGIPQFTSTMRGNLVPMAAPQFIIETVTRSEEKIILVCIGPLTNVALALIACPELGEKVEQIVIMGGSAFYSGNMSPVAEFNVWMDPEAAGVVFTSGISTVMVGLNVTEKIGFTKEDFSALKEKTDPLGSFVYLSVIRWLDYLERTRNVHECYLHDALAVAYLLDKRLMATEIACVTVETNGTLTRGQTVVDIHGGLGKALNTRVCMDVNVKKFHRLILNCLGKL